MKVSQLHKIYYFMQKEGMAGAIGRVFRKLWLGLSHFPANICDFVFLHKYKSMIKDRSKGKNVYILSYCFDWNLPLYQRPHQIASALAKLENSYVLFVSDEYRYDNFSGIFSVKEQLDVVSKRIMPYMDDAFCEAKEVTVFKCWPMQTEWLRHIRCDKLVYEYIDDLSILPYCTDEMIKEHQRLLAKANLTVCTSEMLLKEARTCARKAILSPNGGDYEHFYIARNSEVPKELAEWIAPYECVLGYYGAIAEWFDYDLVCNVAQKRKNWCFVLIGDKSGASKEELCRLEAENIVCLPAQKYEVLPRFAALFDIQVIPFKVNRLTEAVSPVKLFEYMAIGKPILTAPLPECKRYESVRTYTDADDFIKQAEKLLKLAHDPEYLAVMDKEAKDNTWDARVEEIVGSLRGER